MTLKINLSEDGRSVTLKNGAGSFTLTGQELRELLDAVPGLLAADLALPAFPRSQRPEFVLVCSPTLLMRPDARSSDPKVEGAVLSIYTPEFGHLGAALEPEDCRDWSQWLAGQLPAQKGAPLGATLS
ncbi:hypothetical protein [Variovorax saccharolyticus]|uniref:hypothetical protein n=1 Tax=Variovorax saccharolyticus TaxID=3053516 RepID=UPI00257572FB|nr:hypothetical protein [Variovorax sp. J31P216]MDM0030476.1 hypothetical protein [Variovorax sp. J31P216]